MLALYKAGKSSGWLARKFGVSESWPRALAHRSGFRRDYSWHEEVRREAAAGVPLARLADRYGVTWQRVWQIARAA